MNLKQKKTENTLKIRSYMDIKRGVVFSDQKTGAKLLWGKLREGYANWKLKRLRFKVLKAELGAKLLSGANRTGFRGLTGAKLLNKIKELSSCRPFRNMSRKIILKKAFAAITIFAVLVTAYLQNTPYASAATFTL